MLNETLPVYAFCFCIHVRVKFGRFLFTLFARRSFVTLLNTLYCVFEIMNSSSLLETVHAQIINYNLW